MNITEEANAKVIEKRLKCNSKWTNDLYVRPYKTLQGKHRQKTL